MTPPRDVVEIGDFNGLVTAVNPKDSEPGMAEEQVNACSLRQGELQCRAGYRAVSFD